MFDNYPECNRLKQYVNFTCYSCSLSLVAYVGGIQNAVCESKVYFIYCSLKSLNEQKNVNVE